MGRTPCCDKSNVKKGPWSPEEDSRLKQYIEKHGTGGNWISLPQKAGLKRCGKSCRLRWLNYLRPDIKHGDFSVEEDMIIYNLFATIGSRWSVIAAQLPGRTDNDIKNYWNTKLKKKLMSTISSSHKNNPHDPASLSSFLQPSSTNSSSSSSPSSYSDSNQTSYPPLNPTWSSFSSTFEPISFSTNLLNAGGGSFSTNAGAPIHHRAQESFISPMIHQNYHVNEGLVVIRGEASCSSSDGSCRDGSGGGEREEVGGKREYLYDDGVEEKKKKMVFRDCCSGNGWNNEKGDGIWTETPLEYGFEEIKKLISTSSCSDIYFDEN